ncbi:MAG: hypothetical protein HY000_14995 [Planctomycetes bacterium]|nr:hypothetical protein [Planctomycetota bacterium]
MAHSTKGSASRKPKPRFPLTPRGDGRWCKKIRGRMHYFTGTEEEALAEWSRVGPFLLEGRTPPPKELPADGPTVADMVNEFLAVKENRLNAGRISPRTFQDYHTICGRMVKALGRDRLLDDLEPLDFERLRGQLEKTRGPVSLSGDITRIRTVLKFAVDQGLVDRAIRVGQALVKPSAKELRALKEKAEEEGAARCFEARHIRKLLRAADPQQLAMLYLGINVAYGNGDCGRLPRRVVDLKGGWISFARPKTGVRRKARLWPETIAAMKAAIEARPTPQPEAEHLFFVTSKGGSWAKDRADNPIAKQFTKLLVKTRLKRKGACFYALRHTFATVATESLDQLAVDWVMGHIDPSVPARYREKPPSDARLEAVSNFVRAWLFRRGPDAKAWKPEPYRKTRKETSNV